MFGGIASTSERYMASGFSVLAPSGNATVGEVGRDQHVELLERGGELVADHRPHLLRLAVERFVVAGRERVRAEHDAALGLVAEALVARLLVHRPDVAVADAQAVADAVVAGEVRRGLGGGDQVVAGHPVLDRARQGRLPHLGAELAAELDRTSAPLR